MFKRVVMGLLVVSLGVSIGLNVHYLGKVDTLFFRLQDSERRAMDLMTELVKVDPAAQLLHNGEFFLNVFNSFEAFQVHVMCQHWPKRSYPAWGSHGDNYFLLQLVNAAEAWDAINLLRHNLTSRVDGVKSERQRIRAESYQGITEMVAREVSILCPDKLKYLGEMRQLILDNLSRKD